MARRLRKHSYETLLWRCSKTAAEALWQDACGSAMTRRLRRRYGTSSAEALRRDACGSAMARRLRERSGVTPVEAL